MAQLEAGPADTVTVRLDPSDSVSYSPMIGLDGTFSGFSLLALVQPDHAINLVEDIRWPDYSLIWPA